MIVTCQSGTSTQKQVEATSFFVFFLQTGEFGHQLEIVIVTCQSGTSTQKQVEATSFFVFFLQTGGFGHQLEIVIVTCQSGTSTQKQVEATSLDLEQLKVSTTYIMPLIYTRYFSCFRRVRDLCSIWHASLIGLVLGFKESTSFYFPQFY